jgi:hypothetical protein
MTIEKENFEIENSEENSQESTITRREFLKNVALFTGAAVAGGTIEHLTRKTPPNTLPLEEEKQIEDNIKPEKIHGIDVYYMTEMEQVSKLYRNLDKEFAREHRLSNIPTKLNERAQIRKELLNPKERYVEFVIRASAFKSFQKRIEETGVDFVEYAKMTIDSKNLCFENAKPSCELRDVLRRVLIIEDEAIEEIWDKQTEKASKEGEASLLDVYFREAFRETCPLDTDTSWAISDDYRVNTLENENNYKGGCFWSSTDIGKKISFGDPPGAEKKTREYKYPINDGSYQSLKNKKNVWLDFGVSHELIHYSDNLPDEYTYDLYLKGQRKLIMATGSFHRPWVSPFLSILANDHVRTNLRDDKLEGAGIGYDIFADLPDSISLHTDKGSKINSVKVIRFDEERKPFLPKEEDYNSGRGEKIVMDRETLTQNYAHIIQLSVQKKGKEAKLYLPYAPFFMSKVKGYKNVGYEIEIISEDINDSEQQFQIVDESDIKTEYKKFETRLFKPIAKMKIKGTNAWGIWFQRPTEIVG